MKFAILIAIFVFDASFANAQTTCATFDEARSAYRGGEVDRSIEILKCRSKDKKDLDSRRLLADIYWWENRSAGAASVTSALVEEGELDFRSQSTLLRRVKKQSLQVGMTRVASGKATGTELMLQGSHRFDDKSVLYLNLFDAVRSYNELDTIRDRQVEFGYGRNVTRNIVLSGAISQSTERRFLPNTTVNLNADYYSQTDHVYSIGARSAFYENANVPTFMLGYRTPDLGSWYHFTRLYGVTSSKNAFVGVLGLGFKRERLNARITAAGGESLEDVDFYDRFKDAELALGYHVLPAVEVKTTFAARWGDQRSENRIGAGVEWIF